jgi:2Fe-2S ferredoxin
VTRLIIISRDGSETDIIADDDISVMEAIRGSQNDELLALCGGCCSCATCHVYVEKTFIDKLEPASEAESDLLDASPHRSGLSRLSCQIQISRLLDGAKIRIAEDD